MAGTHNERRGRGKEVEVPTHLIKNLELTHAARITKNGKTTKVSSQINGSVYRS